MFVHVLHVWSQLSYTTQWQLIIESVDSISRDDPDVTYI